MTLSEKIQLPLFPLSIFLLPGERTQLHVFEPRYRQLFADIAASGAAFGIPYAVGRLNKGLGARCRLVSVVQEYPSGESDVLIECEGIFRIEDFQSMKEDKLYPYGTVSLLRSIAQETSSVASAQIYERFREELEGTDLHFHPVASDHVLTMLSSLQCTDEEKYRFVLLPDAETRDRVLRERIQLVFSLVQQEKAREHGVYLS
jgi:Lon protease-like protein